MPYEAKFTAKDFNDIRWNVVALKESHRVLDKFPELKKYPEFDESNKDFKKINIAVDKIFRYVILMYSDNVIHRLIPEFAHRKREAAILAGFPLDETGKFNGQVERMLCCEFNAVNDLAVRIMFITKNSEFQRLIAYQDAMFVQMKKLSRLRESEETKGKTGEPSKEKAKEIIQTIEDLSGYIKTLEKSLTNEDTSKNLLERLYTEIEGITLGIRPEEIASAKKQGKLDDVLKQRHKRTVEL